MNRYVPPQRKFKIYPMIRRNYTVYADIGRERHLLASILSVLDTGAGSNFMRRAELPPGAKIRQGPLPDVCNANNRPIAMNASVELVVLLGSCVLKSEFIV